MKSLLIILLVKFHQMSFFILVISQLMLMLMLMVVCFFRFPCQTCVVLSDCQTRIVNTGDVLNSETR